MSTFALEVAFIDRMDCILLVREADNRSILVVDHDVLGLFSQCCGAIPMGMPCGRYAGGVH